MNQTLQETIEHWREQAELCQDGDRGVIHGTEYATGVSAGLNHAADDLEALIEDDSGDEL